MTSWAQRGPATGRFGRAHRTLAVSLRAGKRGAPQTPTAPKVSSRLRHPPRGPTVPQLRTTPVAASPPQPLSVATPEGEGPPPRGPPLSISAQHMLGKKLRRVGAGASDTSTYRRRGVGAGGGSGDVASLNDSPGAGTAFPDEQVLTPPSHRYRHSHVPGGSARRPGSEKRRLVLLPRARSDRAVAEAQAVDDAEAVGAGAPGATGLGLGGDCRNDHGPTAAGGHGGQGQAPPGVGAVPASVGPGRASAAAAGQPSVVASPGRGGAAAARPSMATADGASASPRGGKRKASTLFDYFSRPEGGR